jgi:ketosteroid isomerase-like protein
METSRTVEAFVAAINSGDAEAVARLISEDHVFIDSLGSRMEGRQSTASGWRHYFELFPDYRIEVEKVFVRGAEAMLHGRAGGTFYRPGMIAGRAWEIPAAWRAVVEGERVALWQVYADNKPVYELLAG